MSEDFVVAFTGHRPDKLGGYAADNPQRARVKASIRAALEELRAEHTILRVVTGMALGVDQWAAEVCIELDLPLIAAVPFVGQEKKWPGPAQAHYWELLERVQEVHVVCDGGYASWKMHKRNQWMVEHCDLLLAVWDGAGGGTASCVQYAKEKQRSVKRLEW